MHNKFFIEMYKDWVFAHDFVGIIRTKIHW